MNIVFIVIDALRARNLSCYGYSKKTSPNIDRLAKMGVLFENTYSCINATDPSLTTILSGKYPLSHGIINHGPRVQKEEIPELYKSKTLFLQEILKSKGYTTIAIDWLGRWHKKGYDYYSGPLKDENSIQRLGTKIINNLAYMPLNFPNFYRFAMNSNILKKFFNFGLYIHRMKSKSGKFGNAREVSAHAIELIRKNKKQPFFMFIHYWDTHAPYNAPRKFFRKYINYEGKDDITISELTSRINNEEFKKRLHILGPTAGEIMARYDGAIAFVDYEIGRLIKMLEEYDIIDDTLLIITSDHGESLLEHGIYFDHHGLYDVSIHCPLIIVHPSLGKNRKIRGLVQHVDILPTILDILGIKCQHSVDVDGKSLLPMIDERIVLRDMIYVEESHTQRKIAARTERYKYIFSILNKPCRYCGILHGDTEELYDLKKDPDEKNNIVSEYPKIRSNLRGRLFKLLECLKTRKEKEKIKIASKMLKFYNL